MSLTWISIYALAKLISGIGKDKVPGLIYMNDMPLEMLFPYRFSWNTLPAASFPHIFLYQLSLLLTVTLTAAGTCHSGPDLVLMDYFFVICFMAFLISAG